MLRNTMAGLITITALSSCIALGEDAFEEVYGKNFIGKEIAQVVSEIGPPRDIRKQDQNTMVYE